MGIKKKASVLPDFIFLNLFTSWAENNKDEDVMEVFSSSKNKSQFIKNDKFLLEQLF